MKVEFFKMKYTANCDGGSRGNPGNSAYGVAIFNEEGCLVDSLSEFIGVQTNNVSEYSGLLAALDWAIRKQNSGAKFELVIKADSELMVRQINGVYQCKNETLRPMYLEALRKIHKLGDRVTVEHVRRTENTAADSLVNQVLDRIEKWEKHTAKAA